MPQPSFRPGAHRRTSTAAVDLTTLSDAVNATYDRLDQLRALACAHYARLTIPAAPVAGPIFADGTAALGHQPNSAWILRAALVAAEGLVPTSGGSATFTDTATGFLGDIGRDLRKDGITVEHYAAMSEVLGRALCELYSYPYPGSDLTYQAASRAGLPDGLTELLHTVDLAIRICALGAVDDEDAGIPAVHDAEVLDIQHRSPRVTVVRLRATPVRTGWAGQFLEFRRPADPGSWHSAASSIPPNLEGFLEFALIHPEQEQPQIAVGEHWAVANPTGGLEIPRSTGEDVPPPMVVIALNSGLSAVRALLLDASSRITVPPVHLYWQVDHRDDLYEYQGLLGLAAAFEWLSFTPVVTAPEGDPFDREDAAFTNPVRRGTAVTAAIADGAVNSFSGAHSTQVRTETTRVLVAGESTDSAAVQAVVDALTTAGVDPDHITAEPL